MVKQSDTSATVFGHSWQCLGHDDFGETGGMLIEFSGQSVKLTEPELAAALLAADAIRAGRSILIAQSGEAIDPQDGGLYEPSCEPDKEVA